MTSMNKRPPKKIVMRAGSRPSTGEEPSVEETPPPNMSDRPPPFPLCRRTRKTITSETMIRMTESAISTGVFSPLETRTFLQRCSLLNLHGVECAAVTPSGASATSGHLIVPADRGELTGVATGGAGAEAVSILCRHDRRNVVGFDGTAVL